jgi:hypothetical protein
MPVGDVDVVMVEQGPRCVAKQGRKMSRQWCDQKDPGLRYCRILLEVQQCAKRCAVDFHFAHCHELIADCQAIDAISGAAMAQSRARDQFANRRDCPLKNISGRAGYWLPKHCGSHVGNRAERPGNVAIDLKILVNHTE